MRKDELLRRVVFGAVAEPADVPEGRPCADGLGGVAGHLRDHLHGHQVGIGAGQLFQQAAVDLHHPACVPDGRLDERLAAAADGHAERLRAGIPPAQEGNRVPGFDGVCVGGLPVLPAGDHPIVEIVWG